MEEVDTHGEGKSKAPTCTLAQSVLKAEEPLDCSAGFSAHRKPAVVFRLGMMFLSSKSKSQRSPGIGGIYHLYLLAFSIIY